MNTHVDTVLNICKVTLLQSSSTHGPFIKGSGCYSPGPPSPCWDKGGSPGCWRRIAPSVPVAFDVASHQGLCPQCTSRPGIAPGRFEKDGEIQSRRGVIILPKYNHVDEHEDATSHFVVFFVMSRGTILTHISLIFAWWFFMAMEHGLCDEFPNI